MNGMKIEGEKIILNPIPRTHGHIEITAQLTQGIISAAQVSGLHYRGIAEKMKGLRLEEILPLTARCCGTCWISHLSAASKAQEKLCGFLPNQTCSVFRELLVTISVIIGHIQNFYLDIIPDYISVTPYEYCPDSRFNERSKRIILSNRENFLSAIDELGYNLSLITGRRTHGQGIYLGGGYIEVTPTKVFALNKINNILNEFAKLFANDVYMLSEIYNEYFLIGEGNTNFIDFGFLEDERIAGGYCKAKGKSPVREFEAKTNKITIDDTASWLCMNYAKTGNLPISEIKLDFSKPQAYSSLFSAGYEAMSYEMGALARQQLSGKMKLGVSVMDRIISAANEVFLLSSKLSEMTETVAVGKMSTSSVKSDVSGIGIGVSPSCSGSVIHIINAKKGIVRDYNIISPCHWNFAPMDKNHNPSPLETALVGIEAPDIQTAQIQIVRTLRSFSPCLYCGG